jgi:hypothetical protein
VQADDLQSCVIGLPPNGHSLIRRDIVSIHIDCERRDLEAGVTQLGCVAKGLVEGPVLKGLVANGETHVGDEIGNAEFAE